MASDKMDLSARQPGKPSPRLVSEAISYAVTHSMLVGTSKTSPVGTDLNHAPFAMYPSPIPKQAYEHALSITPLLNSLIIKIANDVPYLQHTLKETADADPQFTGRLLAILTKLNESQKENLNPIQLALCRYDYFIDKFNLKPCMVEMNCIASSFAALGTETNRMHKYLNQHFYDISDTTPSDSLPDNNALNGLVEGIRKAHDAYVYAHAQFIRDNPKWKVCSIMIVQPDEKNAYDQYKLQFGLLSQENIEMVRVTLNELHTNGKIINGEYFVLDDKYVVSVAYFRAGYTPDDYPSEIEWKSRETLEQSNAIKCPTIGIQLVGTKKIQQLLSIPSHLSKFVHDEKEQEMIQHTFVKQLSLSSKEDTLENIEEIIKLVTNNPDDYVLKPQREGGGNNLYGEEMKSQLLKMSESERLAYIIMQRIFPIVVENWIVRNGQVVDNNGAPISIVSELGFYGVVLYNKKSNAVTENFTAGSLLRSKAASQDDGGVAAGVAVLDSPSFV